MRDQRDWGTFHRVEICVICVIRSYYVSGGRRLLRLLLVAVLPTTATLSLFLSELVAGVLHLWHYPLRIRYIMPHILRPAVSYNS